MVTLNATVITRLVGEVLAIDHPQLHVSFVSDFLQMIIGTMIDSPAGFDIGILEQFSIKRYTNGFLDTFEKETVCETITGGM